MWFSPLRLLGLLVMACTFGEAKDSVGASFSSSSNGECGHSTAQRHKEKRIRIGVILPFSRGYPWSIHLTRPALEYARDHIYRDPKLLPNYTIEFDYRDSSCSETTGPLEAVDMYSKKTADIFMGPVCDYAIAPVARFAGPWNIPVITAGALVTAFDKKDQFRTLTRIMGVYSQVGYFIISIMEKFNWTKVGFLLHNNIKDPQKGKSDCWFLLEAVFLAIKKELKPDMDMINVKTFDETDGPPGREKELKSLSELCRGESPWCEWMIVETFECR